MKILAYKGTGLISKAIRWRTRSPWSHVAVLLPDQRVVEAWHRGGVVLASSLSENHAPGTEVSVFAIDYEFDRDAVTQSLLAEVGKKYDLLSVLKFVTLRQATADDRWFCSELVLAKLPFLLGQVWPSHTSPRDIVLSPYLRLEEVVKTV